MATPQIHNAAVRERMLKFAESIPPEDLTPTLAPGAAELINENAFAFSLAVVLDRGTRAEIIWTIPYWIRQVAIDHNLYVHDGFIFEAEYHAGLRIFCAEDPLNPAQVGWFDTYPEDDSGGFDGAWSAPWSSMTAGQDTIMGSDCPPRWTICLKYWKGVLPASAQPAW